jgi:tRNA (mo5U34)-methyltransferase
MLTTAPEGIDFDQMLSQFYWHQGWEIFPGIFTPGRSPVKGLLDNAGVPSDLTGKTVLDIGAWNGCTALECERRGASRVIALSLEDPATTGFTALKEVTQSSKTEFVSGTIYDLDPDLIGRFDIVLCFGVIYHLRYPVLGLDNLRRIALDAVYLESHVLDECLLVDGVERSLGELTGATLMQFYPGSELANDVSNWFSPSISAVSAILRTAGFEVIAELKIAQRGYWTARAMPGLPPFVDQIEGKHTYEGLFYDSSLRRLLGPKEELAVTGIPSPI